MKVRFLFFR